ncbi:MAG: hypothetical protein WDM81_11930 [Rhizomicrobium sp.]
MTKPFTIAPVTKTLTVNAAQARPSTSSPAASTAGGPGATASVARRW